MDDTSLVTIDLGALDHNMAVLRRLVGPGCALCPIVKADAYGMGAGRVAKKLAAHAEMLAVYTPEQAAELAKAAVNAPTLILMPVRDIARVDEVYRWLVSRKLHLTVHDGSHLDDLLRVAERFGAVIPLHLEIDTGLGRGGCTPAEVGMILTRINASRWLSLAGVFTHFPSADSDPELTGRQMSLFEALLDRYAEAIPETCMVHAASSFATLRDARYHRSMVRIGLAWAGYGVEWLQGEPVLEGAETLRPALTWSSRVVQTKTIETGKTVGYGGRWTAGRRTRLGLVPVGYADGYPIVLGDTDRQARPATVGVVLDPAHPSERVFVPVVGAVNMDQVTIDLTDIPNAGIGTTVELISADASAPNHLPRLARSAGTIPHELMCRINPRIRRTYISRSALVEALPATQITAAG